MTGEAKGNRDEIVGDGESKNAADGLMSPMGGLEEGGKEAETGMGEEKVSLAIEERTIGRWGTAEGRLIESEGVIGTVTEVKSAGELVDKLCFLFRGEVAMGMLVVDFQFVCEGGNAFLAITREDVGGEVPVFGQGSQGREDFGTSGFFEEKLGDQFVVAIKAGGGAGVRRQVVAK